MQANVEVANVILQKVDVIHLSRFGKWFPEYEILYLMSGWHMERETQG